MQSTCDVDVFLFMKWTPWHSITSNLLMMIYGNTDDWDSFALDARFSMSLFHSSFRFSFSALCIHSRERKRKKATQRYTCECVWASTLMRMQILWLFQRFEVHCSRFEKPTLNRKTILCHSFFLSLSLSILCTLFSSLMRSN